MTWTEEWITLPLLARGGQMFAAIAFVLLLLVALGVEADAVDLFVLGLASWALHFAWGVYPWRRS